MVLELPATSPAGRTGSGEGNGVKAIGAPGDGSVGGTVYWYGVSGAVPCSWRIRPEMALMPVRLVQ